MAYQLPPDLDERVKAEMSRRGLQSEDDVLREALDALNQLDQDKLAGGKKGMKSRLSRAAAVYLSHWIWNPFSHALRNDSRPALKAVDGKRSMDSAGNP